MPVRRLVLSMSLPMMIAMLVQALYNVVDSYFVAKLSENALTAVGMVFPFQNLMIAVGVGTGVGVNAFLSRSLGEKNYDAANRAAENGVFLAVLSTLVFTVAGPPLHRRTDRYPRYRLLRHRLYAHLRRPVLRAVPGNHVRTAAPGHRAHLLHHAHPGHRGHHQHHHGPGAHLRPGPLPPHGGGGGCRSHRPGPDRGGRPGGAVQPHLQPRYPPNPSGLPPQRPGDPKHLLRGRAVHHSQLHRLCDDLRYEPDPVRLLVHRRGRVQRVFQAPELRVHAGVRPQQRHGAHRLLQLRRP